MVDSINGVDSECREVLLRGGGIQVEGCHGGVGTDVSAVACGIMWQRGSDEEERPS
jgi:hypothetical protein